MEEKYCINCGCDDNFEYIRSTASHSITKATNHYKCKNCGEEFSWTENISDVIEPEPKPEPEYLGCSSHSCYLEKPKGQGTNGRCHCLDGLKVNQRMKVLRLIRRLRDEIKEKGA